MKFWYLPRVKYHTHKLEGEKRQEQKKKKKKKKKKVDISTIDQPKFMYSIINLLGSINWKFHITFVSYVFVRSICEICLENQS